MINRKITLAGRPAGWPSESDFKLVEAEAPRPAEGEALVEMLYVSVDPYQRGRMREVVGYGKALELGDVMTAGAVGRVIGSHDPSLHVGDIVVGTLGWQEYAAAPAKDLRKIDPDVAPITTALGVLGMPGMTAYFGMTEIARAKSGDTAVVSGAAGAVGSLAGQIGKILGCRVIGSAGSDAKVEHVTRDLGFDAAFNYKTTADYGETLRALCPDGVDVYFDNTGGPVTDAVFRRLNTGARIALCGQIAQYNDEKAELGPRILFHLVVKQARAEGFLVFQFADRYAEGIAQMAEWLREDKIAYREQIVDGIENTPSAFLDMMRGANTGKMLVRVKPE